MGQPMTPDELTLDDDRDTIANGIIVAWAFMVASATVLVVAGHLDGWPAFASMSAIFVVMVAADTYIHHAASGDSTPRPQLTDGGEE